MSIHIHTWYIIHTYIYLYYINVIDTHIQHMTSLIHVYTHIPTHTTIRLYTCIYTSIQYTHIYIHILCTCLYSPYSICYHLICTVPYMYSTLYAPILLYTSSHTTHIYIPPYEHSLITISHICHTQAPYEYIDIWGINRPVII